MGHDSHDHGSHSKPSVDPHLVKAEMIKELSPYYDHHDLSIVGKIQHFVAHFFEEHHHAVIHSEGYKAKDLKSYSEREQVTRTVFALKKIKTFNHDFFQTEEEMIIDPLPLGSVSYGMKYAFSGVDAAIATYLWRNSNFNRRTVFFMGALIAAQSVALRVPNLLNEVLIQTPRRRALAARYNDAYGAQFFHDIINPNYNLDHLRHLSNKLNPN